MIFGNIKCTELVLTIRHRQVFIERWSLLSCVRKTSNRVKNLYSVDLETLILSPQHLLLSIFETVNLFLDFWPAFRDQFHCVPVQTYSIVTF